MHYYLLQRIHDSAKISLETAVTFYIMGFHEKKSYLKEIITVHFVIILLIPKKCMRMYYYCAKQYSFFFSHNQLQQHSTIILL